MLKIIIKGLVGVFTIADKAIIILSSAALIAGYLSSYISDEKFTWIFVLSFVMPYLYILNIIIFLTLIVRYRFIWAIIPLFAMILTFNITSATYNVDFLRKYNNDKAKLKILTYNVHQFRDHTWAFKFDSLISSIDTLGVDVMCFQEFETFNITLDSIKKRFPKLKYVHIHLSDSTDTKLTRGSGLAIFSRFPLINQVNVDFENSNNNFQYSNIVIDRDTLMIINTHLQTTGIDNEDKQHIENIQKSTEDTNNAMTYNDVVVPIYTKLIEGNKKRKIQSNLVAEVINNSKYPVLLCGDFNSIPSSYTYRIFTSKCNLEDSFRELGTGFGSTFREFNNMLRIDYILHSKEYKTIKYDSPRFKFSDHYPVIVEIAKVTN